MLDKTDYSIPLSYTRIEETMRYAINQIEDLTEKYAVTADEYGLAEATYEIAFAEFRVQARLEGTPDGSKVTADYAADYATTHTRAERFAVNKAKAKHDATRQALLSVRSRLEALRSLMASYREAGG
jgi:hypothetical protein